MNWKSIFGFIFLLVVVGLLSVYWFIPSDSTEFLMKTRETNFSLDNNSDMQFYKNMRFPEPNISYKIDDCTLQKQEDMKNAFEIVEGLTILDFYPVSFNEEISITCSSENKLEDGMFIAGEGGPTNITQGDKFNVIFGGTILLIKDSSCATPNIALHELFHVLGFNHSENSNNLMYYISKCRQEISEDMLELINELYIIPSYADLSLENVSATMDGRYLNTKFTIRNYGLKDAPSSKILIYADGKEIKSIDMDSVEIGYGRSLSLSNLFIAQLNVDELEFQIETNFPELDKENNKVILEIKT
ncbi:matrixin family metalloprotease [Candidatus Pacearchaeota archaeon]|nr:matrixin family metalloprotease [Candidatus Pacearchaeota archaeon]